MTVRELLEAIEGVNPDAEIMLQISADSDGGNFNAEGYLTTVRSWDCDAPDETKFVYLAGEF